MVKSLTNPFVGRPTPLGTMLSTAGRRLGADLDAALQDAGFENLRSAHTSLFMVIEPSGSTVTELAERAQVTKQSMGELVRYLSGHGYVEVAVSAADRRARIVRLTPEGRRVLEVGARVIEEFDSWLDDTIGAAQVRGLRATLEQIIGSDWQKGPASAGQRGAGD